MWCYNILGDNKGSISHLLHIDPIDPGSVLLNNKPFVLKKENPEPILTFKIIECRKFIDYFGLSIEANPPRVGKNNVYIFRIGYIPIPFIYKLHIERHLLEKEFKL